MLAKIKFVGSEGANRMKFSELAVLEEFLGEAVGYDFLKIDEEGKLSTKEWRETFDVAKVDENTSLVTKSDHVRVYDSKQFVVDLDSMMLKYPNLEYSVKGIPSSAKLDQGSLISMLASLSAKIESSFERFNSEVEFNQKCEVHVPNLGLMNVNRLAFATDKCTEELQELLHEGWRILAVCPQPDQRRPDYILGMNVSDSNERVTVRQF